MLAVLEKKIASLVELIKELKTENAKLAEENAQLAAKLAMMEDSMLTDTKRIDKLSHEKDVTQQAVDDLIKNIDSLIESKNG